ncbi:MAG: S-layer homology domain-containing protein, partial [Patescibacteria group bacterium]
QKDVTRWLKDTIREWNDKERMISQFRKDAKRRDAQISIDEVNQLQSIYEEGIGHIQAAKDALGSGDSDAAREHLESLNDTRMQFDEIVNGFNKGRETQYAKFEMERVGNDLDNAENAINQKWENGEITQEDAEKCLSLVANGRDLLEQWNQVADGGQIGEFEGDQKEVEIGFKNLERQFMKHCGDIIDMGEDEPNIEGYTQVYIDEQFRGTAEDVFKNINVDDITNKILDKLLNDATISNLFNSVLGKISQRFEAEIAKTLEAMSYMADSAQQEILSRQTAMLEQLENSPQVDQQIAKELVGSNLIGEAADQAQEMLKQGKKLTAKDVDALKQKDLEEKFGRKIIPAIDVPDNAWFFGYVTDAYNQNIVSGKDERHFDPAANVTVAEILKMVLNAIGRGASDEEPELGVARNHWASGYIAQAENFGLSIVKELKDPNRPATRAEVVKLILEVAGIQPEAGIESSFKDVSGPDAGYIETAKNLNIVSGDEGKGTFRPNDKVNRAEAAKIIGNVLNLVKAEFVEKFEVETGDDTGIFTDDSGESDVEFIEEDIPTI